MRATARKVTVAGEVPSSGFVQVQPVTTLGSQTGKFGAELKSPLDGCGGRLECDEGVRVQQQLQARRSHR